MIKKAKKYLVPHQENEFTPHILRPKGATSVVALTILLFVVSFFQLNLLSRSGLLSAILPGVLIDSANHSRVENNLSTLKYNELLTEAAQLKANDMALKSYFSHDSPEGLTPWHWFREVGYKFIFAGENLAVNFVDSLPIHQAWMGSAGHKENILSGNFTEIGIATAQGQYQGRNTIFVVEMFGQPVPDFDFTTEVNLAKTREGREGGKQEIETIKETDRFIAVGARGQEGSPLSILPITAGRDSTDDSSISGGKLLGESSYSSWLTKALSRPERTLSIAYVILAGIIVLVLLLTISVEMHRHHPYHILIGFLLLLFILLFLYLSREFVFPNVLIV